MLPGNRQGSRFMSRFVFALLLLCHAAFGARAQDAAYLPYFSSDTAQAMKLVKLNI